MLKLEFMNSKYLVDAFIFDFTDVTVTFVKLRGDCLLITVMLVRFANPKPGLIVATVPFNINPLIALIDT